MVFAELQTNAGRWRRQDEEGWSGVGTAVLRKPATIETRIQTSKSGRRERKVSYLCAAEVVINYHQ